MTQPFILRISDNVDTIDFLGSTFQVMDGGFNISLPEITRDIVSVRQGFYVPGNVSYAYRECTLTFMLSGGTRGQILSNMSRLEKLLRGIDAQMRSMSGKRGELAYAWAGATNITFFEIYGGTIMLPSDVLSVEKIHATDKGNYIIPDIELKLYLSGDGYGVSIYSENLIAVPLANGGTGKTANGVVVKNPGTGQYNYVEIDQADIANYGTTPMITKVVARSDNPYTGWKGLYMGLQTSPFPTSLLFDSANFVDAYAGFNQVDAGAEGGGYRQVNGTGVNIPDDIFMEFAWQLTGAYTGNFFAFLHGWSALPTGVQYALGVNDFVTWGIHYKGDYVSVTPNMVSCPLGFIQLPPVNPLLANYGSLQTDLWIGLFQAGVPETTFTLDYLSLLPMNSGLRFWKSRKQTTSVLTGMMVDDGWRGIEYLKNEGTGVVYTPFYGLLNNLKLEPGVTQRIYFTSFGNLAGMHGSDDRQRSFKIQLYIVPTYFSLAL